MYSHPDNIISRFDLIKIRTNIFHIFRFCDIHVWTSYSGIPIGISRFGRIPSDSGYRHSGAGERLCDLAGEGAHQTRRGGVVSVMMQCGVTPKSELWRLCSTESLVMGDRVECRFGLRTTTTRTRHVSCFVEIVSFMNNNNETSYITK